MAGARSTSFASRLVLGGSSSCPSIAAMRPCSRASIGTLKRSLATHANNDRFVKIVEVSPRDGLQNEKAIVPTGIKVELIQRLQQAGARVIESGSFVSPKWVPQMADTPDVLKQMQVAQGVQYPVLVPNAKGLESLLSLIESNGGKKPTDEIAIFTAASESFCKANTNCSISESLERLSRVTEKALANGLKVRGYISVVAGCPYEGAVSPAKVAEIAEDLLAMGCYEISLGDTVGVGTPSSMEAVMDACVRRAPQKLRPELLAAHCHDTFGSGLANVLALVKLGVRTVDSAVGGLGGCPYSPGATGNIDTESVLYALQREGYETGIDLEKAAQIGQWISEAIGKENKSSAGRAVVARQRLQREKEGTQKAKL